MNSEFAAETQSATRPWCDRTKPISRRSLLRGTGAVLALPWLEAMTSSARADSDSKQPRRSPTRLAVLFVPNGVRQDRWTPSGEAREFELSPTLEPLSAWKDQLLVLTNLWNQASDFGDGALRQNVGIPDVHNHQQVVGD